MPTGPSVLCVCLCGFFFGGAVHDKGLLLALSMLRDYNPGSAQETIHYARDGIWVNSVQCRRLTLYYLFDSFISSLELKKVNYQY